MHVRILPTGRRWKHPNNHLDGRVCPACGATVHGPLGQSTHERWHAELDELLDQLRELLDQLHRLDEEPAGESWTWTTVVDRAAPGTAGGAITGGNGLWVSTNARSAGASTGARARQKIAAAARIIRGPGPGAPVGEENSPYFDQGCNDGQADSDTLSACPPGVALGPDPGKDWSVMYNRGYDRTFHPTPCPCDGSCRRRNRPEPEPETSDSDGGEITGYYDSWVHSRG